MSTRRLKRPSSARRNIKQENFSPYVSQSRLRHIQSLLNGNNKGDDAGPDAVLCVLGIDSRYNEGSLELINYLLFNFFDSRKLEIERSGFAEEIIDDMMFLIRPSSVDIYCNPINYNYLLPYVAHWRNLHFHCLTDEVYEADDEKAEEFKIQSFISMCDGCCRVGIPYTATGQTSGEGFDIMAIEKWPIVQAFALEGFGGGGFFTMKHSVADMSSTVQRVYNLMDPVAVETMVTEQLPLFERQWSTLLSYVDLDKVSLCKNITEGKIAEPLQSYFSHGRLGSAKGPRSRPSAREPFVLFGTHTNRQYFENVQKASISSNSDISSTGLKGNAAQHMIVQAVSPRSPICCRRTYFFTHGIVPNPLAKPKNDVPNFEKSDVRVLQLIYSACIDAVHAAIRTYAHTLSTIRAEALARQALVESCDKTRPKIRPKHLVGKETVHFSLQAFNNQNSIVPLEEGVSTPLAKTVMVTVYDVPSVEHPGQVAGSVSFAETFLESSVHILKADEDIELDGRVLVLTEHVPTRAEWPCGPEQSLTQQIHEHVKSATTFSGVLGRTLITGETAQLVTQTAGLVTDDGHIHLYENGLIYEHRHLCPVVLPKSALSGLHFYDGDSPSTVAILIVTYRESVRPHLPVNLRTPSHQIIFAFQPKSKVYKTLFSEVLSVWKCEDAEPHLGVLEDLPEELIDIHSSLQATYKFQSLPNPSHLQQAKARLPQLHSFLHHFECGSVGSSPVPSKHLPVAIGEEWDAGGYFGDTQQQLIVTILSGPPGGGKTTVCASISKIVDWYHLTASSSRQSDASPDSFNPHQLHRALSQAWTRKRADSEGKIRALLVVPGLTDTVDVVQTIVTHPDKDLLKKINIGAVTVCVDPHSVYMSDSFTLPKLLDICAQGWVNNIIFSTNSKSSELDRVQGLVRATNSDVALMLANKGEITRSTDMDLILSETAFDGTALLRARYLSCPGWRTGTYCSGPARPAVKENILTFSQPLEKPRLLQKLRGLKAAMTKSYPYAGNIYHVRGNIHFTESSRQQYHIEYSILSDSLHISPAAAAHTAQINGTSHNGAGGAASFMAFLGCQLEENRLKEWLRGCAQQKPEKSVKRTRASLTKAEVNRIHKEHHLDSLPEGWFYNGSKFVSMAADKSDTHPNLEQFISEYLSKVNKEVDAYNAKMDSINYTDLFD